MHILAGVTTEISNGMNEMASGTEQITKAVEEVNDGSTANKAELEDLRREVTKFKI